MSRSRARNFSRLIDNNRKIKSIFLDSDSIVSSAEKGVSVEVSGTVTVYSLIASLPASATAGDLAWVSSNNSYYIFNGSGWFKILFATSNPYWVTEPSSYTYADQGSTFTVEIAADDSDDQPLTFSATADANFLNIGTVTVDSEGTKSARFLIQFDSENIDSEDGGEGNIVFSATDGVNIINSTAPFSLDFGSPWITQKNTIYHNTLQPGNAGSQTYSFNVSSETQGSSFGYNTPRFAKSQTNTTMNGTLAVRGTGSTGQMHGFPFASETWADISTFTMDPYTLGSPANTPNTDTTTYVNHGIGYSDGTYGYIYRFSVPTHSPYPTTWKSKQTDFVADSQPTNTYRASRARMRFPFAALDAFTNSTGRDPGDINFADYGGIAYQSKTYGYVVGGAAPMSQGNAASSRKGYKFPFAGMGDNTTALTDFSSPGSPMNNYGARHVDVGKMQSTDNAYAWHVPRYTWTGSPWPQSYVMTDAFYRFPFASDNTSRLNTDYQLAPQYNNGSAVGYSSHETKGIFHRGYFPQYSPNANMYRGAIEMPWANETQSSLGTTIYTAAGEAKVSGIWGY